MTHLNPDPLHVDDALNEAYERGIQTGRNYRRAEVLAASAAVLLLVASAFLAGRVVAAPRSAAQPAIPAATQETVEAPELPAASGNPVAQSTAEPTGEVSAIQGGIASYVGQRFGPVYLALPEGPGIRVTICSAIACVTRTSTDAGPDLAMQRRGLIADVSYRDFGLLCGCRPETLGLVRVTVTDAGAGPTPPATDLELP